MKNKLILCLIAGIVIFTIPMPSYAWGSATHVYLAEKLGNKNGIMNEQEMYGATLADVFNLMFGYEHRGYLWGQTHYGFMQLVDAAEPEEKALAYGFASHNEAWGADRTAHIQALTIEGNNGYVIIKSIELAPLLQPSIRELIEMLLVANGIYPPYGPEIGALITELSLVLADSGVESAVDYLVSQNEDKKVGSRMLASAQGRDASVPMLLSEAYAAGLAAEAEITLLEASTIIIGTEAVFQTQIMSYGAILAQENAMELMAEQGAELAIVMIEARYGLVVPPALYEQVFQKVKNLITFTLLEAIEVVEDDYAEELEATQKYVKKQLNTHKIKTFRGED